MDCKPTVSVSKVLICWDVDDECHGWPSLCHQTSGEQQAGKEKKKKHPRWCQGSDRNGQTERKLPVNVKRASLSARRVEPSTGWAAAAADHIWKHLEPGSRLQGWPPSNTKGWMCHASLLIFGPADAHGSLSTAQDSLQWLLLKYRITSRIQRNTPGMKREACVCRSYTMFRPSEVCLQQPVKAERMIYAALKAADKVFTW